MPELPEVEVVRRGLAAHVTGKTITAVRVHHPRAVRRHEAGPADLTARLLGSRISGTGRRGKYLWLTLEDGPDEPLARRESGPDEPLARREFGPDEPLARRENGPDEPLAGREPSSALVVHLGMSGQMLLGELPTSAGARSEEQPTSAGARSRQQPTSAGASDPPRQPNENHLRIAALLDDGTTVSFVDQRTFGGWMVTELVDVDGAAVPEPVAHIARDPLDPGFDRDAVVDVLRHKNSEIKRQLLDQTVVSGIGNIYADEALWRARVNPTRLASGLSRRKLAELLDAAAAVMSDALGQGGTSFDSLYVNVNGESGYFDRSLDAYGRDGQPCRRCGAVMRREKFMNRSSCYCPRCQPRPRAR